MTGTTARSARDQMPRAEPRSGGPKVEHGEDPPVDAVVRPVQAAAPQEDTTARGGPESSSVLILSFDQDLVPFIDDTECR
jgi:hypothetical protein